MRAPRESFLTQIPALLGGHIAVARCLFIGSWGLKAHVFGHDLVARGAIESQTGTICHLHLSGESRA